MYVVKTPEIDTEFSGLVKLVEEDHLPNLAIKKANEQLSAGKDSYDLHIALAKAHKEKGNEEDELKEYRLALKMKDEKTLYYKIASLQSSVSIKKMPKRKGIFAKHIEHVEWKKITKAYEAAMNADPTIKLFSEVIDIFEERPESIIIYGERAVNIFPNNPEFYVSLSNAHKQLGNPIDSYGYMWKAIELKYNDAEFIRDHFGDRIDETINNDSNLMIVNRLLNHNNKENRNNYEILKMISDFYRQKKEHALKNEFFEYLSEARLRTSKGKDLSAEYDLVSIEAYPLCFKEDIDRINRKLVNVPVNQAAYDKIVGRFAALKAKGFDVDNGHFNSAIAYNAYFKENVNNTFPQSPRPKLELLH